jgi:hypothetical protein
MTETVDTHPMRQVAPYPQALAGLLGQLRYKDGWRFELRDIDRGQGSHGLTLVITIRTPDSYHPESVISVAHYMPVPPAAYDGRHRRPDVRHATPSLRPEPRAGQRPVPGP